MRTRNKRYSDYGLTDKNVNQVFEYMTRVSDQELADIKSILDSNFNAYYSALLYKAFTERKGYYKLDSENELYISSSDFYGYRRKAIALIWKYMGERNERKTRTGKASRKDMDR